MALSITSAFCWSVRPFRTAKCTTWRTSFCPPCLSISSRQWATSFEVRLPPPPTPPRLRVRAAPVARTLAETNEQRHVHVEEHRREKVAPRGPPPPTCFWSARAQSVSPEEQPLAPRASDLRISRRNSRGACSPTRTKAFSRSRLRKTSTPAPCCAPESADRTEKRRTR